MSSETTLVNHNLSTDSSTVKIRGVFAVLNRKVRKGIIADKILNACVILQYVGKPVLHIVVSSDNPFCLAELPLIAPCPCFAVPHLYLLKVLKMKNQHPFSTVRMPF
jgi:hypothetical protein